MNTNLNISNSEYNELISQKAPKSHIIRNVIAAFIVGGLICVLGQFINNKMINLGMDKETSSTITSISLVFIAALLTSLNLFSRIGKFAGTGATVPITGFSNSIVAPAIEYKSEGYILGLGTNMFKVAGPVLVYGISTSVLLGFVYYLLNYVF